MSIVLNTNTTINKDIKHYANSNTIQYKPTSSGLLQTSEYQIRVLGIAEQGAKSRVETQIRLGLELVTSDGDKVNNQWSHIKLPDDMLTLKRRNNALLSNHHKKKPSLTINEPSLPKDESSILYLNAKVICESDNHRHVKMCHRCVWREWKRADRKKAGKRLGNLLYDEALMEQERQRILLFNSEPFVHFNDGECILPTRITCYSRHHDERLGFRIQFTLSDHQGKIIAKGDTPPVMITDDHKNLSKLGDKRRRRKRRKSSSDVMTPTTMKKEEETLPTPEEDPLTTFEESNNSTLHVSPLMPNNTMHPSSFFLNQDLITNNEEENNSYYLDPSLFLSTSHLHHPSTTTTATATATTTSTNSFQDFPLFIPSLWPSPSSPSFTSTTELSSPLSSSPSSPITIPSNGLTSSNSLLISPELQQNYQQQQQHHHHQQQNHQQSLQNLYDIESLTMLPPPLTTSFSSSSTTSSSSSSSLSPMIEKIIPDHASMVGGTEITILGSHFHEGMTCYFGNKPALTTTYWSPSTLVCVVPSTNQLGPVLITLGKNNNSNNNNDSNDNTTFMTNLSSPIIFTYDPTTIASNTNKNNDIISTSSSKTTSPSLSPNPIMNHDNNLESYLSSLLTVPNWNEEEIQALTWQVYNLSMANNLLDARQVALRLIELQKQHQSISSDVI
ncbi:unnamed protein product [Cunninghamella blakesleeana]